MADDKQPKKAAPRKAGRQKGAAQTQRPKMASEAVGPNGVPFGRKVAKLRRDLGLSQVRLGKLMNRSEAWVSQVERGARHIDRMSVLEKLAGVLMVDVADLAPDLPMRQHDSMRAAPPVAGPLAMALAERMKVSNRVSDIDKVERDVADAYRKVNAAGYQSGGESLIPLLPRIEYLIRQPDESIRRRAQVSKARAYQAIAAVLAKVDDAGAAWVAADRAINAADQAGDPLLTVEGAFKLCLLFHSSRRPDLAERVAITAREAVAGQDSPGARSLYGALTLQLALLASRCERADIAYQHLADAEAVAAKQNPDEPDTHETEFGPRAVRLHEVAIAVDLGDAGRAVRVGEAVDTDGLSDERKAGLRLSLARAYSQRRDMTAAAQAVLAAVELSPDLVTSTRWLIPLVIELKTMDLLSDGIDALEDLLATHGH
jgi:transcriptional regulator with XRE-family HTH domain